MQPPMKTLAILAETISTFRMGSPHLAALIMVMVNEVIARRGRETLTTVSRVILQIDREPFDEQ
jgi:hypothetical protein